MAFLSTSRNVINRQTTFLSSNSNICETAAVSIDKKQTANTDADQWTNTNGFNHQDHNHRLNHQYTNLPNKAIKDNNHWMTDPFRGPVHNSSLATFFAYPSRHLTPIQISCEDVKRRSVILDWKKKRETPAFLCFGAFVIVRDCSDMFQRWNGC